MADRPDAIAALHGALGHDFSDSGLLEQALTHRSWCAENGNVESNERLEFLGDAVLGMAITEALYRNRRDHAEGDLAKARAEVVSATSLAALARELDLGPLLHLGRGEELSQGRDKTSILADAMEAIIAAVFLDAGWAAAQNVVTGLLGDVAEAAQVQPGAFDHKTRLQERAAELGLDAPAYRIAVQGPDHGRRFTAEVEVGVICGTGTGTSKKQAQQAAAAAALDSLAGCESDENQIMSNPLAAQAAGLDGEAVGEGAPE